VKRDDPIRAEHASVIRGLNQDEQIDLVALAWLGRGDGDVADSDDIRVNAAGAHNRRYLLGMPLPGDHLEEARATRPLNRRIRTTVTDLEHAISRQCRSAGLAATSFLGPA
jgi:hypothetical protein